MPSRSARDKGRTLRRHATDAERELWRHLRVSVSLRNTYFRRQVPLGPYIADFCCFGRRLIIELDGSQHGRDETIAADMHRTQYLEQKGYRVLRFWNHQVFREMDTVLDTISAALSDPHP